MNSEQLTYEAWISGARHIVVFDLEWTSWPGYWESNWTLPGKHREIIQIGAVKVDCANAFAEQSAFDLLVKPIIDPELSPYIQKLTGLSQTRVDAEGLPFSEALDQFVDYCADADYVCFNGLDDIVIEENCDLNGLTYPQLIADKARNVRLLFTETLRMADKDLNSCDLTEHFGLPTVGQHHDGLADARGIAAALKHLKLG